MMHKIKQVACLLLATVTLAACQPKNNQPDSLVIEKNADGYYDFPTVESRYSPEEVTAFNHQIENNELEEVEDIAFTKITYIPMIDRLPQSLYYDSGIHINYPEDGVKGLYLTEFNVANPEYFAYIVNFVKQSGLNAVVIDFKDDWGHIIPPNESTNPLVQENTVATVDYHAILKTLEENQIYPIARITTFKDNLLSTLRPDLSFIDMHTGEVWQDLAGAQFTNPFLKETWDYVIDVAVEAAKMGFKDIQFDYVRFPEGFYEWDEDLIFEVGPYADLVVENLEDSGYERTAAINDFLAYAQEQLMPYGVDISADIFGYTTVAGDTYDVRGIGQNFREMAEQVDVVSAMIYPSHWGPGYFGLDYPDLHPYELVDIYIQEELAILETVDNPVKTRPWLQDFTASYLPDGTYREYDIYEVQAQVDALAAHGIHEFLLWNASGDYTEGVNYHP